MPPADRRDDEGVFIEKGGRDTSYAAVSVLMAEVLVLYLPNPELDAAITQTVAWLRTRIDAETGAVSVAGNTRTGVGLEAGVSGKPKEVNYPEVAQALAYYGAIYGDASATALAEKVAAHGG